MNKNEHNGIRVLLLQELDAIANEVYQDVRGDMDSRELTDLFALKITHRLKHALTEANSSRDGERIAGEVKTELAQGSNNFEESN
jgi:hypothetical protein